VTNNVTYAYQLRALDAGGQTIGFSDVVSVTPGSVGRFINTCSASPEYLITFGSAAPFDPDQCRIRLEGVDATESPGTYEGSVLIKSTITQTGKITLVYTPGLRSGIIDGPGYDLAYYPKPSTSGSQGIDMPFSQIELSEDGSTWITVFSWDGNTQPYDSATNITSASSDGEVHAEFIPSNIAPIVLLADPDSSPPPNWATGIGIDIKPTLPAGKHYRFIRFSQPNLTSDNSNVDAIYRIN
jgi:hypothetical protein